MPSLVAFMGGIADSGARYKIEIRTTSVGEYEACAYNAGAATGWSKPTTIRVSTDLAEVVRAASTKFAEKTRPGRDRVYVHPFNGGPKAGPFPKGVTSLPDHPLCWQQGDPLNRLPYELQPEVGDPGQPGATPC
jgi:hypothetical protein